MADKAQSILDNKHFQTYRRFPVTFTKGMGMKVFDTNGKQYLDALAGIAVNNTGHCHPKVVEALQKQAAELIHISNLYHNIPQSQLAEKLTDITGYRRVFFCNSGLEAVEGALKIARKFGEQNGKDGDIISFTGCFHGRSIASITMGKEAFQKGFGPLPAGFSVLPFNDIKALDNIKDNTKAVFVECVQGEGGIHPADKAFVQRLANICKEKKILLVADEIQSGMGRTGKLFAFEHYGIQPDIITMAKGLGSGIPIGAILANSKTAEVLQPGDHGSTFGGGLLACASALATLQVIEEENLIENAATIGQYLLTELQKLAKKYPEIHEVRGKGLMLGIAFDKPCRPLALRLLENGLLVSCTAMQVIRLVPPLIITRHDADQILDILKNTLMKGV